jgi:hypothetical protein
MFCCYFLSMLYQWITDELLIDKLDEYENMIELQPIVRAAATQQLEVGVVLVVAAATEPASVAIDVIDETCNDPLLQQAVESPPYTARLRKQIQTEEELYKDDFEIIEMCDIKDAEKKD